MSAFDLSVALISDEMRLIEMVCQAHQSFDKLFTVVGGQAIFRSRATAARFRALLDRAEVAAVDGKSRWVSDVVAQPSSGGTPLLIRILAEPRAGFRAGLVVLIDLDRDQIVPQAILQSSFGLTPAEASLAAKLVSGNSLKDICEDRHIQMSTGRTQLAGVLAKTGTARQSALVSKLARLSICATESRLEVSG